jgi:hypothetical protein
MSFAFSYEIDPSDQSPSAKNVNGVLSIEGEELLFEFKVYDESRTSISALNKYSITVDLLKSIRFKKTLFNSYVIIETGKPVFLGPLPGVPRQSIQLKIDREQRKQAEEFCSKINVALERRNKNL